MTTGEAPAATPDGGSGTHDDALVVRPAARLRGSPGLPGDKSISHRALLLALLARGESTIAAAGDGEDVRSTAGIVAALGATVERSAPHLERQPPRIPPFDDLRAHRRERPRHPRHGTPPQGCVPVENDRPAGARGENAEEEARRRARISAVDPRARLPGFRSGHSHRAGRPGFELRPETHERRRRRAHVEAGREAGDETASFGERVQDQRAM